MQQDHKNFHTIYMTVGHKYSNFTHSDKFGAFAASQVLHQSWSKPKKKAH